MKARKYSLRNIRYIQSAKLVYLDENNLEEQVDLKKSAEIYYDIHYKHINKKPLLPQVGEYITNILLRRKRKNRYVGDRFWSMKECYIRLYNQEGEIKFIAKISGDENTSDYSEVRTLYCSIRNEIQKQGYWLFDEN